MKREKQLNAKNVELKKYKEEQPLKLGMMQCKHYNCYDINEVLKKANLNQFCEEKREWQALFCHSFFVRKSFSHYDQNYGRNYDQKQVLYYDRKQVQNGFFCDIKKYEVILKENQLGQPTQQPSCRKVLSVFPYALFFLFCFICQMPF